MAASIASGCQQLSCTVYTNVYSMYYSIVAESFQDFFAG